MKITKIKSLGFQQTYNLEMKSKHHNYVTTKQNGQPIHANSHAYAYGVIAYRALWLKAHYPTEFWASILSYCHPDKVPKYVGVAKLEGVNFKPLRVGHLSSKLTVDENLNTYPSLIMVKGIGESVAELFSENRGVCDSIDDFVEKYGKKKGPIERLIKLGAFDSIHGNRKALWHWYQYKYCSKSPEVDLIKKTINDYFMSKYWPNEKLQEERQRQIKEFRELHPKKRIPVKISNWTPKYGPKHDNPSREDFMNIWLNWFNMDDDELINDINYTPEDLSIFRDWSFKEILEFEKAYLGVYWTSPMSMFKHNPKFTFNNAREEECAPVDGVVEKTTTGKTKNDNKYVNLWVNDGIETNSIRIWGNTAEHQDDIVFQEGVGVRVPTEWNERYQNFNLVRNNSIHTLRTKDAASE